MAWFDADCMQAVGWWDAWHRFKSLPWPGTIYEQPAVVAEAIDICEGELAKIAKEQKPKDG